MNILFIHRNFPAQFKHILAELKKDSKNNIFFITNNEEIDIGGIQKFVYKLKDSASINSQSCLNYYEDAVLHGREVSEIALRLKKDGFKPDIIYAHSWGSAMFIKDIFPDVPLLCYFEWFYNAEGADAGFGAKPLSVNQRAYLRCKNASSLVELTASDAGICPTNWQLKQFPKEFHDKIKVIPDGIDTEICKPDCDAKFIIKEKKLVLGANDEVLTYATRGMEAYRGFPQFMVAASELLKKRPNLHVVIAGEDEVFYGPQLTDMTFKQMMLKELEFDMDKVHFVGKLPYNQYVKLLQISSVHVYLTYPFVLSWSLLEAMSAGCCIVASDTEPVLEVIKDNYNGLLCNFFNFNQLAQKIEYALDNKSEMLQIRNNARKTIVDKYALDVLLPVHLDYITNLALQNKS